MFPLRNLRRYFIKALRQPVYAARVLGRRLRAYGAYARGGGGAPPPEAITLFLTRLCNLRCKMCGQWGDVGAARTQDPQRLNRFLPLDEVRIILNDVSAFKPSITLFGGEPLMHPQAVEIVRRVKEKGMHCLIITNGTMVEPMAEELVAAGLDELNVSVDGDRELHDGIRGVPGMFDRIMAGLARVNALKKERKASRPLVNIQCTISRFNYEHLDRLPQVARQAGADSLTFHHLIFLTRALTEAQKKWDKALRCSSQDWEGFIFEPGIDPARLRESLRGVRRLRPGFPVDVYPNFSDKAAEQYYANRDYLPSEYVPRCLSPWVCAYVFPEGDVRPCLNCSYSFGNIMQKSFLGVWNSPQALAYRQLLKKEGLFPACRRCTELYRY